MALVVYLLSYSKPGPRCMLWKRRTFGLSFYAVPMFPNQIHLCKLQILPLSSAPDLGLLPALPCMGPNTPLHIQVSVSLMTYKLNVSYCYFPFWVHALRNGHINICRKICFQSSWRSNKLSSLPCCPRIDEVERVQPQDWERLKTIAL
jgi:hypothetical protein